ERLHRRATEAERDARRDGAAAAERGGDRGAGPPGLARGTGRFVGRARRGPNPATVHPRGIAEAPDSVCAAMYLLRHRVPASGKKRLTLRIDPERENEPKRARWHGDTVARRHQRRVRLQRGAGGYAPAPHTRP